MPRYVVHLSDPFNQESAVTLHADTISPGDDSLIFRFDGQKIAEVPTANLRMLWIDG